MDGVMRTVVTPKPEVLEACQRAYDAALTAGAESPIWDAVLRWEGHRHGCIETMELPAVGSFEELP